jgi:hypothetical protein
MHLSRAYIFRGQVSLADIYRHAHRACISSGVCVRTVRVMDVHVIGVHVIGIYLMSVHLIGVHLIGVHLLGYAY